MPCSQETYLARRDVFERIARIISATDPPLLLVNDFDDNLLPCPVLGSIVVRPQKIWRNVGACPGDVLILTKPIGLGVLATAMKRGMLDRVGSSAAIEVMSELNRAAAKVTQAYSVHACTDITGFGLLGHLLEMTRGSQVEALVFCVMSRCWTEPGS